MTIVEATEVIDLIRASLELLMVLVPGGIVAWIFHIIRMRKRRRRAPKHRRIAVCRGGL